MFEYHFTGYVACNDPYYYSSSSPVDVTVYADNRAEALKKAESALGYKIHLGTMRCVAKEVICPNCGGKNPMSDHEFFKSSATSMIKKRWIMSDYKVHFWNKG